jgi:hypothetical protein
MKGNLTGGGRSRFIHNTPLELYIAADVNIASGCSKRPSSKAAASKEARRYIPSFA